MSASNTYPQTKGRRRGRALGIAAAGVLVVAAAGAGGLAYGVAQAQGPINAAKAYCTDLKTQNYTAAYSLLSSGYQSQVTRSDYLGDAALHDQLDGKVVDCGQPHSGTFTWNLETSGAQSLDVKITRTKQADGTISLVKQGDSWKVDAIADALQGTDLGGYKLAQTFCTDFLAGNYAAAYQLFSAKGQQNYGSEQQFAAAFQGAFSNGVSLAQCAPDLTTYTVTSPSAQVTLKLAISEATSLGTTTFPLPNGATLKLVKVSGTWKVDELNLNVPNA